MLTLWRKLSGTPRSQLNKYDFCLVIKELQKNPEGFAALPSGLFLMV